MPFGINSERRSSTGSVPKTLEGGRRRSSLRLLGLSFRSSQSSSTTDEDIIRTPDSQNTTFSSKHTSFLQSPRLRSTDSNGDASCITHYLTAPFEKKVVSRKLPTTYEESEFDPGSWKATLLLQPGFRTRRYEVLEGLNRKFSIRLCRQCWELNTELMELFSFSTLYSLEFLNYASLSVNKSHFSRFRKTFTDTLAEWRSFTLITTLIHFGKILADIEHVMLVSAEPVLMMHGSDSWRDIIKEAVARDVEEFSEILLNVIKQEDLTRLKHSERTAIVDAVQLASKHCGVSWMSFDHFLREAAEKLGILPSAIIIPGIQRLGDNPLHGGGFADVWKGELGGSYFALKALRVFNETDNEKLEKDFNKEAMLWRRLEHPNVLAFLGISRDVFAPRIALVSKWMDNGNLAAFVRDAQNVNCGNLIEGVASGLRYLHDLIPQIVHGDLRAANILIDENLEPRITDFGLARVLDSQASATASSFRGRGTPRWQAPELLNVTRFVNLNDFAGVSTMSDVYAFACVCLEVFTGEVPFPKLIDGAAIMEVAVHDRRPPKPDSGIALERGFDDVYWELMQMCWRTHAAERPDMEFVVEWLETGGANRPEEVDEVEGEEPEKEENMDVDIDAECKVEVEKVGSNGKTPEEESQVAVAEEDDTEYTDEQQQYGLAL
ncbi:hypothetical protein M0805_009037 [Coniferiporia weirii]|nr:hypothetical protein M0805_009037 [Coniferiporia weirii]